MKATEHFDQLPETNASSLGAWLADQRHGRKLAQHEVAAKAGLSVAQVQALESDDHSSLGAPVFAKGYLMRYARALDLDADQILTRFRGQSDRELPPLKVVRSVKPQARSTDMRTWSYLFVLIAIVAVVWLAYQHGGDLVNSLGNRLGLWPAEETVSVSGRNTNAGQLALPPNPGSLNLPPPGPDEPAPAAGLDQLSSSAPMTLSSLDAPLPPPPTPAAVAPQPSPLPAGNLNDEPVDTAPVDDAAPGLVLDAPDDPPVGTSSSLDSPVASETPPAPAATDSLDDGAPVVDADAAEDDIDAASEPVASEPETAAPVSVASAGGTATLTVTVRDDCWVEIKDANGERLAYGVIKRGETRTLEGPAPFAVTLGNAQAVDIALNGAAVAPAVYMPPNGSVSRFTLDPGAL